MFPYHIGDLGLVRALVVLSPMGRRDSLEFVGLSLEFQIASFSLAEQLVKGGWTGKKTFSGWGRENPYFMSTGPAGQSHVHTSEGSVFAGRLLCSSCFVLHKVTSSTFSSSRCGVDVVWPVFLVCSCLLPPNVETCLFFSGWVACWHGRSPRRMRRWLPRGVLHEAGLTERRQIARQFAQ